MYKSLIKSKELFDNSQDVLEDILQVSIFNKGSLSISVFGIEIEPNSPPFVINASVSYFDFKLEEIVLTKGKLTPNQTKEIEALNLRIRDNTELLASGTLDEKDTLDIYSSIKANEGTIETIINSVPSNKVLLLFQKVMLPKELKTNHCN